jgi:hypothetical protein
MCKAGLMIGLIFAFWWPAWLILES